MSQVIQKFIENATGNKSSGVNGLKFRLDNAQALRARNAANTADISLFQLSSSDVLQALVSLSMNNFRITSVLDPIAAQDAATKNYVDRAFAGLTEPKAPVQAATTTALVPASTYANGTNGTGATLTGTTNGVLPAIDGYTAAVGDRLLIKNEGGGSSSISNGIYVVTQLGSSTTPYILTRASDADNSADASLINYGLFVTAQQGANYANQGFYLSGPTGTLTIGTSALAFSQFGANIVAGQGIQKIGNVISVLSGNGLTFSGTSLIVAIDSALLSLATTKFNASGQLVGPRRFKFNSSTSYTLTSTDITAQYLDLAQVASQGSIEVYPVGGPCQVENSDYTVNYTGGLNSKTRVMFSGDIGSGGAAALVAGDKINISYQSLDY